MFWKPAAASCLIVPGKSLAMPSLTGHVWQPIGRPSGLAWSSNALEARRLVAAAVLAAVFRNSLLGISGILGSLSSFVSIAIFESGGVNPAPTERSAIRLLFFAEEFDVFGAFLKRASIAALNQLPNLRHDVRIRQRRDVAGIHVIGNRCQHA